MEQWGFYPPAASTSARRLWIQCSSVELFGRLCQLSIGTPGNRSGSSFNSFKFIGFFSASYLPSSIEASEEFVSGAWWTSNKNQISKPNRFMHEPISLVISDAPPPELLRINPCARNNYPIMEKSASFGSGLSELSSEFERDEDGIKGVGSKVPKLLNLFA
ncbi:Hypothetical predicted protein [Olea europaea subsp. europaea]|uniref:Uncharacterized protein n=1 Tax=Olea europaea subsp. europaea TaxID=158383 RepID=A0A8S0SB71_OLEEU|nr:Hypothetical predicted protein [Olea europaea subsp. europaea]